MRDRNIVGNRKRGHSSIALVIESSCELEAGISGGLIIRLIRFGVQVNEEVNGYEENFNRVQPASTKTLPIPRTPG
jgi:hypothetical protein